MAIWFVRSCMHQYHVRTWHTSALNQRYGNMECRTVPNLSRSVTLTVTSFPLLVVLISDAILHAIADFTTELKLKHQRDNSAHFCEDSYWVPTFKGKVVYPNRVSAVETTWCHYVHEGSSWCRLDDFHSRAWNLLPTPGYWLVGTLCCDDMVPS